jgi:hypothetical protein
MRDRFMQLKRIYVEKKDGFQVEANALFHDLRNNLGIKGLKKVRIIDRYDVEGIGEEEYLKARDIVFYKPMVEYLYEEEPPVEPGQLVFGVELLPGQYDQRADSIAQCIQILTCKDKPVVKAAKLIVLSGNVSDDEFKKIKDYYINPIESRETSEEVPVSLESKPESSQDVKILSGFINMNEEELIKFSNSMNLAMNLDDLKFCQEYFRDTEKRDPSITEIKVIDTYWSDHCRHTTFLTGFRQVVFEEGHYFQKIKEAYDKYQEMRRYVYDVTPKKECLMDIATIVMKQMKKQGLLDDLDESSEINACSIKVQVDVDGENLESVRDERARLLREQEHPSKTSQSEAQQQVQTQNKEQQNDNKNTQHSDPKPDWNSLEKTIETLHEHWNSFEPSARMDGAMNETIKEFGKQLINLTEQIIARNEEKTMVAATNLYSSLPDFLKLYDHNQPPEIKEVIGLVRLIIIYGQQEKWEETKPLLKQIKEAWQEAKTKMKKPDEMLNKRIESAINDFQLVVAEKKNDIAKIKGNIIIKNLDQIE